MKKDYSTLIIEYLQGELNKKELESFYIWVNSDLTNKKMFFEIKAIYDVCISSNKPFHVENSWIRLLKKRKNLNLQLYFTVRKILSYAAVVLITVLITTFFFSTEGKGDLSSRYIGGDGLEADIVILPDGTKVSIGSKTIFYYEKDFGKKQRNVFLKGEAYFEVTGDKKKPFIVNIDGQKIEALGTKFNIMAYPSDSIYITTLLGGALQLTTDLIEDKTILKPNQQYVYNRNSQSFQVNNVDASRYISWISGYYYFPAQTLNAISHRLGSLYGISFDIQSEKLGNKVFTGTFYRGQSIQDIMQIIKMSIPIKYNIDDELVRIYE